MNTSSLRSIQAVLAIGSFFLLTAAKGDGCGTSVIVDPPPPPPPPQMCPIGSHIVTICDDPVVGSEEESTTSSSSGGFGTGGASSTGAGGFGTSTGSGTVTATTGGGGFSTTGAGPDEPPNPGSCHDECVPDDACPPGMHNELICGGEDDIDYGSSSSTSSGSGSSSGGPGSGEELPYPGDCVNSCVPDQCPIGTVPVTTCIDGCDGMGTCTITCEPVGDGQAD
ncbi:MAG: hypothetical protein ABI193_17725 [Minicystis sp.]